jgi:ABC-type Fe3+ transport system substrate-binding protein
MLSDTCQKMATEEFYRYPISKNVSVNPDMIPMDQLNLIDYDFIWSGDNKVNLV